MIVLGVVAVRLLLWLVARVRGRRRRAFSSTVLADVLGWRAPYRGPRWRVGDKWL